MERYKKKSLPSSQHFLLSNQIPSQFQGFIKSDDGCYRNSSISSTASSPGSSPEDRSLLSPFDTQPFLEPRKSNQNQFIANGNNGALPVPIHPSRTRCTSETGTNTTYLSSCSVDLIGKNRKYSDNQNYFEGQQTQALTDEPFHDPSYGNRSFSLLRNVYLEKKSSIQITLLLILLGLTAAIGTVFMLSILGAAAEADIILDNLPLLPNEGNLTTGTDLQALPTNGNTKQANNFENKNTKREIQIQSDERSIPVPLPVASPIIQKSAQIQTLKKGQDQGQPKASKNVKSLTDAKTEINPKPMGFPAILSTTTVVVPAPAVERETTQKTHQSLKNPPNHSYRNENRKPSHIKITSAADFKKINAMATTVVDTIVVEKLVDDMIHNSGENPHDLQIKNTESVKHLKISGPITEAWLECLLTRFEKLEHLSINVDELCIGAKVGDRDSLSSIKLNNLVKLHIENLHFCSITSWVFRWETPKIKELLVQSADLTKRIFTPMHTFLEKSKHVVSSVVISKSFICPGCTVADIEYSNSANIEILDEQEKPHMFS